MVCPQETNTQIINLEKLMPIHFQFMNNSGIKSQGSKGCAPTYHEIYRNPTINSKLAVKGGEDLVKVFRSYPHLRILKPNY